MAELAGYTVNETLDSKADLIIYRAKRQHDNVRVILKLTRENPTNNHIAALKHEYHVLNQLKIRGVISAYRFFRHQNSWVLELEDSDGLSLHHFLHNKPLGIGRFLEIALQLVDIIGKLHKNHIIHKDINPHNIIINANTLSVTLIDMSIATQLEEVNQEYANPGMLEGTIAYISPEQTGRINRKMDYRSDYYSLGVTFFEMLTGKLPFSADDPMELVYYHIAKVPPLASEINPNVPVMLAKIIAKLLAKTPEQRYLSIEGLKHDLILCQEEWKKHQSIPEFMIGSKDSPNNLHIPQKLYGRDNELQTLHMAFERIGEGGTTEFLLISGYSGIGKTALVKEMLKAITKKRGYFATGKFDQLQHNTPYSAIINAFSAIAKQVLAMPEQELQIIRQELLNELGSIGQVMIDLVPEIELIIGPQPALPPVSAIEAQNRMNLALQHFIRCFAKKDHPLVIYLDDLQWIDSASLSLIEIVLTSENIENLLLIGAYRDNEVSASHPLQLTLDFLQKSHIRLPEVKLQAMQLQDIQQLLMETFNCDEKQIVALSQLLLEKTHGNPFFIIQFLKTLYKENRIYFDPLQEKWGWNIEKIESLNVTENVIDLMNRNLKNLPQETQHILTLAACIGNKFNLQTLSYVDGNAITTIAEQLEPALANGYILPIGKNYQRVESFELINDSHFLDEEISYQFLHDRVQQAAYELLPQDKKNTYHLSIGKLLLYNLPPKERQERIFDIINQINYGLELIDEPKEKIEFASLNLEAGKKAKLSSAYAAAMSYLHAAIKLLPESAWEKNYELTLQIHEEATELAMLLANFKEMDTHINTILKNARTLLDKIKVYEIKIDSFTMRDQNREGMLAGFEVLKLLGIKIDYPVKKWHIIRELLKTKWALRKTHIPDLFNLPTMTDQKQLAIVRILNALNYSAYRDDRMVMLLGTCKIIQLSLIYGTSPISAVNYSTYGIVLCGLMEDFDRGEEFGQLSLKLASERPDQRSQCSCRHVYHYFIAPWKQHIRQCSDSLRKVYYDAMERGDFLSANISIALNFSLMLHGGESLEKIQSEGEKYLRELAKLQNKTYLYLQQMAIQYSQNLMGKSEDPFIFSGKFYDENKMLPSHLAEKNTTCLYTLYARKVRIAYILKDFKLAIEYAEKALENIQGATGSFSIAPFFHSLAMVSSYPTADKKSQKIFLSKIKNNQKKLKKYMKNAPMNYEHKYLLVEAELARIAKNTQKAMKLYEKAIQLARENEFTDEEAFANERAAEFYFSLGFEKLGKTYMMDAYYTYQRWGAFVKTAALEKEYPQLMLEKKEAPQDVLINTMSMDDTIKSERYGQGTLDLISILKASQAISKEIILENLLKKLLKIVMENAGAQRGAIIVNRADAWVVEAEGFLEEENVQLPAQQLDSRKNLPVTLLQYAQRTRKSILLNNIEEHLPELVELGLTDYVNEFKPKSILCVPIIKSRHIGIILYLETKTIANAFSRKNLKILRLLSSQIAISLENAYLYQAGKRFVPYEFLRELNKRLSLVDLQLGDQVKKNLTVMFCDIRGFTALSEEIGAENTLKFINQFLSYMEPLIHKHNGFIDKYMGDAIMALFVESTDDALSAAIDMVKNLKNFIEKNPEYPIKMGIGINTGDLMLGIVGTDHRMETSVMGDSVNIASRLESQTKVYDLPLLISGEAKNSLQNPENFMLRLIDRVIVKGKTVPIEVWEVFDSDTDNMKQIKKNGIARFNQARALYEQKKYQEALALFNRYAAEHPEDTVVKFYIDRCKNSETN